jgi:hypothetical protein
MVLTYISEEVGQFVGLSGESHRLTTVDFTFRFRISVRCRILAS